MKNNVRLSQIVINEQNIFMDKVLKSIKKSLNDQGLKNVKILETENPESIWGLIAKQDCDFRVYAFLIKYKNHEFLACPTASSNTLVLFHVTENEKKTKIGSYQQIDWLFNNINKFIEKL